LGLTLFLNRRSGSVSSETEQQLRELLGDDLQIQDLSEGRLGEENATALRNSNVVIAAGGDGTISAVASYLVGSETALGILPLGTANHFARDIGVPAKLPEAVQTVLYGKRITVDTATVNGRLFVNNSALGLYPRMVIYREALEKRGFPRWAALCRAILHILLNYRRMDVEFETGGKGISRRTSLLFVGNNIYALQGFRAGSRKSLQDGQLVVVIARHAGMWSFLNSIFRVLMGRAQDSDALEILHLESLTVRTRSKRAVVAIDGEVIVLRSPLTYKIAPRSLTVLVPQ
jgi:diacylglycerol kinase family enzyme